MFNLFGRGKNVVQNPAILICSIGGATVFPEDREIYAPYPNVVEHRSNSVSDFDLYLENKKFDIVHLFADFANDGTVDGHAGIRLLQLLTRADVKLALFASNNSGDQYMAAFPPEKRPGVDNMHLVMTLDRKGDNFFNSFKSILALMAEGKSMPVAWVTLAPQHEGPWMEKMPDTIFLARRGQLKFVP